MRALFALSMALLAACGGEGPPAQEKQELPQLTGVATYDETVATGDVSVKGVSGTPRTATNSLGTREYSVRADALTPPYILRWKGSDKSDRAVTLYALATATGNANITPLTTLVVAQLLGGEPSTTYASFGASGGPRTELVNSANLADAQAKVVAFLQDTLGVTVENATADFTTTPFKAAAGDPMFDSIEALDHALTARSLTIDSVTTQLAALAALCIREKMLITMDGRRHELCPSTKTANREDADNTIIDYVFKSPNNETLTINVRDNDVLSAAYVNSAGTSFTCTGVACGGIALGIPAEDLTRALTFTNTDLAGAVLSGTLVGAIPGVALPVLPCDNNKYYVIFPDRTVVGDCVDANDFGLGLGGTLNAYRGAEPSRAVYTFSNSSSTDPTMPGIEIVTDANDSLLSVFFYRTDPATGDLSVRYVCQAAACNGVTLGPVTENIDVLGPEIPISIREVGFDNTVLTAIDTPDDAVTLKGQFRTEYFIDPSIVARFPERLDCVPGSDAISMTAESGPFNFCSAPANRHTTPFENGDVALGTFDDQTGQPLDVTVHDGLVTEVRYQNGNVNSTFSCSADCSGVVVSTDRKVTFTNTVLHEEQSFPIPGTRTLTLSSGPIAFPAPGP